MITLLIILLVTTLFLHYVLHLYNKYDLKQTKLLFQEELNKFASIGLEKDKASVNQLMLLIEWVNNQLPNKISYIVLSDIELTDMKEKAKISDVTYIKAFEGVITEFQNVVSLRVQDTVDEINKLHINSLKKLMD